MKQLIKPIPFDNQFEQECEATIMGKIDQIVENENSIAYTLDQVCIYPNRETKYPMKEKIIAYISSKEKIKYNNENEVLKDTSTLSHTYEDFKKIKIGNQVKIFGTIKKLQKPTNEGQFDARAYYIAKGVHYLVFADSMTCIDNSYSRYSNMLCTVRKKLSNVYTEILPKEETGIIRAMLLGEKNTLDTDMKELYQKNGIAHILAISGVKTPNLVSPMTAESGLKWAFMRLHIVKKYIQNLCFKGQNLCPCPFRFRGG